MLSGRSGATRCSPQCAGPQGATISGASGCRCRSRRRHRRISVAQFLAAYEADYVTREGKLVIDDPQVRQRLIKAIDGYTAIYRKGCTPPNSVTWADIGNNERFLAQMVVMTPNKSLSIVNALKRERPEDYYKNTATSNGHWVLRRALRDQPLFFATPFFRDAGHTATAKSLSVSSSPRAGSRTISTSPANVCCRRCQAARQPFWLDPSDPHRMAAVMQVASRPTLQLRRRHGRLSATPV